MRSCRKDYLGRLRFPGPLAGGFPPQFLDSILHIRQLHPEREPSAIYFNGGSVTERGIREVFCHGAMLLDRPVHRHTADS
jgi:hypothetical protein